MSPVNIKVSPLTKQKNKSMLCLCVCSYSKRKSVMGQHKSLFSTQKEIAQVKKKRPLRFNYTSPLLLTRKKCTLAMSFHNQDTCTCCFLLANSYFLLLPMLSRVSLLGTGMQPQWWSLEKKSSDSPYLCMSVGMLVPDAWFLFYFLQGLASFTEFFFSDAWVRLSISCFFQWVSNSFSPLVCLLVS